MFIYLCNLSLKILMFHGGTSGTILSKLHPAVVLCFSCSTSETPSFCVSAEYHILLCTGVCSFMSCHHPATVKVTSLLIGGLPHPVFNKKSHAVLRSFRASIHQLLLSWVFWISPFAKRKDLKTSHCLICLFLQCWSYGCFNTGIKNPTLNGAVTRIGPLLTLTVGRDAPHPCTGRFFGSEAKPRRTAFLHEPAF